MSKAKEKYTRKKLRTSYVSSVISISLVLLLLGMAGSVLISARKISTWAKERIGMEIYFRFTANEAEVMRFKKELDVSPFVKSTEHITPEEAKEIAAENLGIDLIDDYIPLPSTIVVKLNANYAHPDSIGWIKERIMLNPDVRELEYRDDVVSKVNEKFWIIGVAILVLSCFLLIIAIALIYNTIRLSMYSNRFLIRSMQLVGATNSFIRKPYLWSGLAQGFFGSLIALAMLSGSVVLVLEFLPDLKVVQDLELFGALFLALILIGIFISFICTSFAVRKYLRLRLDELY